MKTANILENFITAQGYEIERLSKLSGVTTSEIELILEGKITPSTATAIRLSRVLKVEVELLIDGNEAYNPEVITKTERVSNRDCNSTELLSPNKAMRNMEPKMLTLLKDEKSQTTASEGEEFIYVVSGCVMLVYGEKSIEINAGESTYIDSIAAHYFKSTSEKSEILIVKHSSI